MPEEVKPVYQSFLVRCWLLGSATAETPAIWRFELRKVAAEPREQRFADLEWLKNFLAKELAAIAAGRRSKKVKAQSMEWEATGS